MFKLFRATVNILSFHSPSIRFFWKFHIWLGNKRYHDTYPFIHRAALQCAPYEIANQLTSFCTMHIVVDYSKRLDYSKINKPYTYPNLCSEMQYSFPEKMPTNRQATHQHWLKLTKTLKGALSCLRQFLTVERPLKLMKNTFYFTSKALFVFKIFKCLSWAD